MDGDDLRLDPLHARKDTLSTVLMRAAPGVRFNEHMEEEDGSLVFHHACKLGLESDYRAIKAAPRIPCTRW